MMKNTNKAVKFKCRVAKVAEEIKKQIIGGNLRARISKDTLYRARISRISEENQKHII